jgi:hypothetical protein
MASSLRGGGQFSTLNRSPNFAITSGLMVCPSAASAVLSSERENALLFSDFSDT